eukprot:CAMPEP_0197040794 /NCGR_PEP_ID=MMETSP1384-20130603/17444_1 /TAXON_ID=29189 /ORGANISM="Ammonia sp." /LENGTH=243 /DNA_ID=CAMNT_0042471617 /DNA_START=80 /DNA_END=811 /DNA_ORIENTATION=-
MISWSALLCVVSLWSELKTANGGVVYMTVPSPGLSWADAQTACSSITVTGQLATWSSHREYEALVESVEAVGLGLHQAWVGLTDASVEGTWVFSDGDTSYCDDFGTPANCVNLPQWSWDQPSNSGTGEGEDCATMTGYYENKLGDQLCTQSLAYVCEFAIDGVIAADSGAAEPEPPVTNPNNYYVLEFTSIKDIMVVVSALLNVLCFAIICSLSAKLAAKQSSASMYSKVRVAIDDEAEELKL